MLKIEIKRLEKMIKIFEEIQEAQLKFQKFDHKVKQLKKIFSQSQDKKNIVEKLLHGVVLSESEIILFLKFIVNKL